MEMGIEMDMGMGIEKWRWRGTWGGKHRRGHGHGCGNEWIMHDIAERVMIALLHRVALLHATTRHRLLHV